MKKPQFVHAEFSYNLNGKWYSVLFRQMVDKRYYQIDVRNDNGGDDMSLIESYIEKHLATKTVALFYLCRALNLSTNNIH